MLIVSPSLYSSIALEFYLVLVEKFGLEIGR